MKTFSTTAISSYERLDGVTIPHPNQSSKYCTTDFGGKNPTTVLHNQGIKVVIDDGDDVSCQECCNWCMERFFTREKLRRRFPFIRWISNYSWADFCGDVIAGVSVTFALIPQALAYAVLAGLPPQYGLYTSFIGCFVYAFLGSCKDVAFGPTSIMAIIIAPYVAMGGPHYAVLLALLSGCVQLAFGLLNLGFVIDFVSFPVISSFSSAAAITIAFSQLKGFFGMKYSASRFIDSVYKFFYHIPNINPLDTMLGIGCLSFLVLLHFAKNSSWTRRRRTDGCCARMMKGFWSILITGRNAVVVLVGALIAVISGWTRLTLTKEIQGGLPAFHVPSFFVIHGVHQSNDTNEYHVESESPMGDLGVGMFVVALLGLLETVAVAQAFTKSGKKLDATQEMIALGVGNILGSFFGAFPATGAFSRSAVNHNSGVRTPFGGIVTGGLVLLALSEFASYFQYIPQTALCSIVISAVIFVIKPMDCVMIWQTNKVDILPYIGTMLACFTLGLEYGIVVGVALSIIILLYQMARPKVHIFSRTTSDGYPFLYVKPDRSVFFPSIEYMKVKINKALNHDDDPRPSYYHYPILAVVIDGEHMFRADSTFAVGVKSMINCLRNQGVICILYTLRKSVLRAIRGVSLTPGEFYHCKTEKEIFSIIRNYYNQAARRSSITNEQEQSQRNTLGWASQSCDAF